jgi:hypothetical protein
MEFSFIQLTAFTNQWNKFRLSDEDLRALENQLQKNPKAGDVLRGTGGLRKVRFAPPSRHIGKSGAFRVGFAYFRVASTVYPFSIFAKQNQANLTAAECSKAKKVIETLSRIHMAGVQRS